MRRRMVSLSEGVYTVLILPHRGCLRKFPHEPRGSDRPPEGRGPPTRFRPGGCDRRRLTAADWRLAPLARRWFCRRDGIHSSPGDSLPAPQARLGRRPQPAHAGNDLSHRRARRACRRTGHDRALCLGDRLSQRDPRAPARPGRLSSQVDARRGSSRRGRYGAAVGTRVRRVGRPGLGRQEHVALEPTVGKLVRSGGYAYQRITRVRRTGDGGPLRHLPGLHRRLSDGRDRRTLPSRRTEVHLLSNDRAPRADSARAAHVDRPADLRLRHLPGRLPLQSPTAADRRTGLSAAARFESDRAGRIASHGRCGLSPAIPRQSDLAGQAARSTLPSRVCPGQSAGQNAPCRR